MKQSRRTGPFDRGKRWRQLGDRAPQFHVGLRPRRRNGDKVFDLPFRRSPLVILISGGFLAVFSIPLFTVSGLFDGSGDGSLFDLTFSLFTLFWLLGWSVGVALLLLVFLALCFGRELLVLRPGSLILRIELLGLGMGAEYLGSEISNVRPRTVEKSDSNAWRGEHLAFDYAGEPVGFGSSIPATDPAGLINQIQALVIDQPRPAGLSWSPGNNPWPAVQSTQAEASAIVSAPAFEPGLGALSTRFLLLANLVPLLGVLFAGWRIGDIMLLFWAESAIIGFYNLLRMWVIGRWSILFLGPFFVGHYGGFMVGHLLFIYAFFQAGFDNPDPAAAEVLRDFIGLWPALLGLLISHGVSFRTNFLARREFESMTVREQMSAPYKRIIVMHVTIIFGGFLTMAFNAPVLALLLLIVLKTAVDAGAHVVEHRKQRCRAGNSVPESG